MQSALALLACGELAAAEAQARKLATDPAAPTPRAFLIAAVACQQQKRYDQAIQAYKDFLSGCSSESLRQYALEQIDMCKAAADGVRAPALPSAALNDQDKFDLSEIGADECAESSQHFVVRSRNAKLSKLVASQAEKSLARICRDVLGGQEFAHNVDVYVWMDPKDFHANAKDAPEWASGSFSISVTSGVASRRIDLTQLDKDGAFSAAMLDSILPHELCHLVTKEYFGDAPYPLFLDEGLATTAQWQVDNDRFVLAGSAVSGKEKIPLEKLLLSTRADIGRLPKDAGDKAAAARGRPSGARSSAAGPAAGSAALADVSGHGPQGTAASIFYAESLSFVQFLKDRLTDRQFSDFLDHVKSGCTIGDALERAMYLPHNEEFLPSVAKAWEEHAVQQAQVIRALRGEDLSLAEE